MGVDRADREPMGDAPEEAVEQALGVLRRQARSRDEIYYSDFVKLIPALPDLQEHGDPRLWDLLDEVSKREEKAGRGLLSVLVVRQRELEPGDGFFRLIRAHRPGLWGKACSVELAERERELVFAAYAAPPPVSGLEKEIQGPKPRKVPRRRRPTRAG